MNNIKLFSDSTCDLSAEDISKMDVGIIPLVVTFGEDIYKDGVNITPKDLFNIVDQRKILPKTSAPSPVDFYNAFKPYADNGDIIIYIGLSSKISTTIQNARLAAEHIGNNKVYVIDSLNLSGAIGALIRYAYSYAESGMPAMEIVDKINAIVPKYKLFFTIDTLDYLHMGGRCSSTESIFGKMLDIKPIIEMSVNGLDVWKKTMGKKKAIKLMIDEAIKDKDKILNNEIHLAYAMGNEKEGKLVKKLLEQSTGITKYYEYTIGCVISSHCGDGTVGFGYYLK